MPEAAGTPSTNSNSPAIPNNKNVWMLVTCTAAALALVAYLYHLHRSCSDLMEEQRQPTASRAVLQTQQPRVYELVYASRDARDANLWVFSDASASAIAAMRSASVGLLLADGNYYSVRYVMPTSLLLTPLSKAVTAGAVDNSTINAPGLTLHVVGWPAR